MKYFAHSTALFHLRKSCRLEQVILTTAATYRRGFSCKTTIASFKSHLSSSIYYNCSSISHLVRLNFAKDPESDHRVRLFRTSNALTTSKCRAPWDITWWLFQTDALVIKMCDFQEIHWFASSENVPGSTSSNFSNTMSVLQLWKLPTARQYHTHICFLRYFVW